MKRFHYCLIVPGIGLGLDMLIFGGVEASTVHLSIGFILAALILPKQGGVAE